MDTALSRHKNKLRGIIACILVALASKFLSLNYGAPTMLFALILGMSVNFLNESEYSIPGIDFCSTTVLRFGVILLGAKILFGDVLALGWVTALVVVGCMFATILFGALIARALKLDYRFGMLSGGAVGICGIAAAMTLSSVMPKSKEMEQYTLLTVIMVATFGAVAMVSYPVLASFREPGNPKTKAIRCLLRTSIPDAISSTSCKRPLGILIVTSTIKSLLRGSISS